MKKIIGVALILVVVLFALPFVVRQAQDTGQDPQPTAQEEAAHPGRGPTSRVYTREAPDDEDGVEH